MKRSLFLLILVAVIPEYTAQFVPSESRTIYGLSVEEPVELRFAEPWGNHHLIVGTRQSNYFISHLDDTLKLLWTKEFDGMDCIITDLYAVPGGAVYVTSFEGLAAVRGVCSKLNGNGDTLWTRRLMFNGYDVVKPLCVEGTKDSGIVVGVMVENSISGERGGALQKIDKDGSLLWSRLYSKDSKKIQIRGVRELKDSGLITVGSIGAANDDTAFVSRFSSTGGHIWTIYTANYSGADVCVKDSMIYAYFQGPTVVKTGLSGNILSAASISEGYGGHTKISIVKGGLLINAGSFVVKLDENLEVLWSEDQQFNPVQGYQTPNGKYWLNHQGPNAGIRSAFPQSMIGILEIDSANVYGGCYDGYTQIHSSSVSPVFVNDTLDEANEGSVISYAVQLSSKILYSRKGCVDYRSGIDDPVQALETDVFPVPADERILVRFKSGRTGVYACRLHDAMGKVVTSTMLDFSRGEAEIDCAALPSGVYNLQLRKGNMFLNRKILIHH